MIQTIFSYAASLAAALEYGYYNIERGEYDDKSCRVLFVDSGATHTSIFVVLYENVFILDSFHS